MKILIVVFLLGVLLIPNVLAQTSSVDMMISDMRTVHTDLEKNMKNVIQLIKNNHTQEALNLLEGMDIRINHMDDMFNDLVWQLSNRGH